MNIKPLYTVLLVAGVALLAVGVTLAFALQVPEPTQAPSQQPAYQPPPSYEPPAPSQQPPAYNPPLTPPTQPNLALCQEYLEMSRHCHNEAMGCLKIAERYQDLAERALDAAQMAGQPPSPLVGEWLDTAQDYMDKADSLERESRMYKALYNQCISQR